LAVWAKQDARVSVRQNGPAVTETGRSIPAKTRQDTSRPGRGAVKTFGVAVEVLTVMVVACGAVVSCWAALGRPAISHPRAIIVITAPAARQRWPELVFRCSERVLGIRRPPY
jgi:hypothetical protein